MPGADCMELTKAHYYRLSKVIQTCLNAVALSKPEFVELCLSDTTTPDGPTEKYSSMPIAILSGSYGLSLEILIAAPFEFVNAVL